MYKASKEAERQFSDLANAIGTNEMLRLLCLRVNAYHSAVYFRKLNRVYEWVTSKDDS